MRNLGKWGFASGDALRKMPSFELIVTQDVGQLADQHIAIARVFAWDADPQDQAHIHRAGFVPKNIFEQSGGLSLRTPLT